ncbi:hypothetical protein BDF19DRAFT_451055 [Syncephalis fuscata]|nr:hypothetical protein BDF19DRAFT_451055 [Syncephalis fuscata]
MKSPVLTSGYRSHVSSVYHCIHSTMFINVFLFACLSVVHPRYSMQLKISNLSSNRLIV